jgi:hypothetical protein
MYVGYFFLYVILRQSFIAWVPEVSVVEASQVEVGHALVLLEEVAVLANVADLLAEAHDRAVDVLQSILLISVSAEIYGHNLI